jgi:hypothetical protein
MEMPSSYELMSERWDDLLDEQYRVQPIGQDPETGEKIYWGDSTWITCGWNPDSIWSEDDLDNIPF